MHKLLLPSLLLALAACAPKAKTDDTGAGPEADADTDTDTDTDTDADADTDTDTDTDTDAQTTAVVATVASDYSTGSFATVSLDDWTVNDELFVTSGDPAVSADEGMVFQINRYGSDTMRMYEPGTWDAPVWETALEDGSNPHEARVCDGKVFTTLYGADSIGVYDPSTGNLAGAVDLSGFADSDATGPEADTLVELDGKLYVAMNRLNRDAYWADEGGVVAEVDCSGETVSASWSVGGNTTVHPWPGQDGELLVLARAYGDDASGIYALDPAADTVSYIGGLDGYDPIGIAAWGDRAIVAGLASDWSSYAIACVDLGTGETLSLDTTNSYITDVAVNDRGEAWLAAGPSWLDPDADAGLFVYDIATCTEMDGSPIGLSLYPMSVAFY